LAHGHPCIDSRSDALRYRFLGERGSTFLEGDAARRDALKEPNNVPAERRFDDPAQVAFNNKVVSGHRESLVHTPLPFDHSPITREQRQSFDNDLEPIIRHRPHTRFEVIRVLGAPHRIVDGLGYELGPIATVGRVVFLRRPHDGVNHANGLGSVELTPVPFGQFGYLGIGRRPLRPRGRSKGVKRRAAEKGSQTPSHRRALIEQSSFCGPRGDQILNEALACSSQLYTLRISNTLNKLNRDGHAINRRSHSSA